MRQTSSDKLRYADRPARLWYLVSRDAAISAQLHALTTERARNRDEATTLRVSLTGDEAVEYETLRLEAMI